MSSSLNTTVIHPTAIVEQGAKLGVGVKIGPFSIIGSDVELHDNVEITSHVSIAGDTKIGKGTKVFPFAAIGHEPQDLKYHGEKSKLVIGKNCTIRESATLHPGTQDGGMITSVGDDCLLMVGTHIAHDCRVGNNVIMANLSGLAGHCIAGDYVTIGGMVTVHQFTRIGSHSFIGAHSMVDADVIPYGMVIGNRARLAGLNLVGLKRRGFSRDEIHTLRAAYRMLFSSEGTFRERIEDASSMFAGASHVKEISDFIIASDRSICLPRNGGSNN